MMETATTLATQSLDEVASTPLVLPASLCDKLRHPSTFNPLAPAWNSLSSLWTATPPLSGDAAKFLAVFDSWMRAKKDPGFWYSFERSGPSAVKLVLTMSGTVFVRHGKSELGTLSDALSSVTGLTRLARVLNHHSLLPLILHDLWAAPLLAQCQKVAGEFMKTLAYRLAMAPPGAQNVVQTVLDLFKSICCQFDYKFELSFGARWELQFYFLRVEGRGRQPGSALYSALTSYFELSRHPGGFPADLACQLQKLDSEVNVLSTPAVSADQFMFQRQNSPPAYPSDTRNVYIQDHPSLAQESPPWRHLPGSRHSQAPMRRQRCYSRSPSSDDIFRASKSARYGTDPVELDADAAHLSWFKSSDWDQIPGPSHSNSHANRHSVFGQHGSYALEAGPDSVFACRSESPEMLPAEPDSGTDSEDEARWNVNMTGTRPVEPRRKIPPVNLAPEPQMINEASASLTILAPEPSPSKKGRKTWLDDPERCRADPRWVFLVQALALYDSPSPKEPQGSWEMTLDVKAGGLDRDSPTTFTVYLLRPNQPEVTFVHTSFGNALCGVFRELQTNLETRDEADHVRGYLVGKILDISPPSDAADDDRVMDHIFRVGKDKKQATGLASWFTDQIKGGLFYLGNLLGHSAIKQPGQTVDKNEAEELQLATLKRLQSHNTFLALYLGLNFLVDSRQWYYVSVRALDVLNFLEDDGARPISTIPGYDPDGEELFLQHQKCRAAKRAAKKDRKRIQVQEEIASDLLGVGSS